MAKPPAPATALLPHVDELVLEYLLFRGFTRSFQALAAERKRDRTKGFDVEQITSQLLAFVQNFQLEPMLDTWKFLDARFFSRLDASYTATIRQLEDAWLRLYVVHAIKSGHRDKAVEFFRLLADKLNAKSSASGGESWHRWFILPYVQHPESDPFFRSFFEKQWLDSFVTSFRNFLSLIFRNMALPKLLALQVGRLEEPTLKLRLKTSQSECSRLRLQNAKSAEKIHRLEDAGLKMLHMVETLVQHTFAEHFVDVDAGFSWSDKIPEDGAAAPEVVKALSALSSQLVELREALGPASRNDAARMDHELLVVLDDPLAFKLNAVTPPAKGTSSDQDAAITIIGMSSSPSSSSLQSADSVPSPAHASSFKLQPALVEEVSLAFDSSDAKEGICKYAHDGRRLVTSRVGEHTIQVLGINVDGHTVERENIQTEAAIVGVDWVAHSEYLVYALEDGTINVWDTDAKARTFIISYNADERRPSRLACAPSKAVGAVALMAAAGDFTEASNVTRVQFFAFEEQAIRVLSSVELQGTADVSSLCWASEGSTLAVVDSIGNVSFVSPSEASILGSWRLGTAEFPISGVCFGPGGQSLLVVGASARLVMEWSVSDLVATRSSDPPPHRAVYRLPPEMTGTDGITARLIEIQGARSLFAVSSNTKSSRDIWTVYTRDRPDPVMTVPTQVAGHIDALAWHPLDNALAVTTEAGKLYVWKLSEQSGGM